MHSSRTKILWELLTRSKPAEITFKQDKLSTIGTQAVDSDKSTKNTWLRKELKLTSKSSEPSMKTNRQELDTEYKQNLSWKPIKNACKKQVWLVGNILQVSVKPVLRCTRGQWNSTTNDEWSLASTFSKLTLLSNKKINERSKWPLTRSYSQG